MFSKLSFIIILPLPVINLARNDIMKNEMAKLPLLFSVIFFHVCFVEPHSPVIFGFGDSLIDTGNNNVLLTAVKADYLPYGIDYVVDIFGFNISGIPTGRFTDRFNLIDLLAKYANLPSPPPYLSLDGLFGDTGANFASGSCGMLNVTGAEFGDCSNFDQQVKNFEDKRDIMVLSFQNLSDFENYLSKCLCVVVVGNNDYMTNYFSNFFMYDQFKAYNCTQYAEILAGAMTENLERLYYLGCRRYVITNIAAVGCTPYERDQSGIPANKCNETQNSCIAIYNSMLKHQVIRNMKSFFPGFNAILMDLWTPVRDCARHPSACGFKTSSVPCCGIFLNGTCTLLDLPCPNRSANMFFDGVHPTESMYDIFVKACFNETDPSPCDRPIGTIIYK
ncbi:hypothetical protein Droror1_Dr00024367 [Drosera rotundifolia]